MKSQAAQILFILCSKYSTFMQIVSHCTMCAWEWVTKWLLKGGGSVLVEKLIRIVIWNFIDINFRQEIIKVHIYLHTISGSLWAAATIPFFIEQESTLSAFVKKIALVGGPVLLLHASTEGWFGRGEHNMMMKWSLPFGVETSCWIWKEFPSSHLNFNNLHFRFAIHFKILVLPFLGHKSCVCGRKVSSDEKHKKFNNFESFFQLLPIRKRFRWTTTQKFIECQCQKLKRGWGRMDWNDSGRLLARRKQILSKSMVRWLSLTLWFIVCISLWGFALCSQLCIVCGLDIEAQEISAVELLSLVLTGR